MATVYLGRSEEWFWKCTPRKLVNMIKQWNEIEKQKAKVAGICLYACMNGKNPDEFLGGTEQKKATEAQMRKNASAFFG
jgi:hypothetical protein